MEINCYAVSCAAHPNRYKRKVCQRHMQSLHAAHPNKYKQKICQCLATVPQEGLILLQNSSPLIRP